MNTKFAALVALGSLSLAAMAPQAAAADNGLYLGAGITQTEFDVEDAGSGELADNSFKLIVGFRPLDWLAFEANYLDLGGEAVADPAINAVVCASGTARLRQSDAIRDARRRLTDRALTEGPEALTDREKLVLLNDPLALSHLHFQVWVSPDAAPRWRQACLTSDRALCNDARS